MLVYAGLLMLQSALSCILSFASLCELVSPFLLKRSRGSTFKLWDVG